MARKRYRSTSRTERDAVAQSKGPRRVTPGQGASKAQRREHSRKMQKASLVKAQDTRETRQALYAARDQFQAENSAQVATRQKEITRIMFNASKYGSDEIQARLDSDAGEGYAVRTSTTVTAVNGNKRTKAMLAVKPAVYSEHVDSDGKVTRQRVSPAEYRIVTVSDKGDISVSRPVDGGAASYRQWIIDMVVDAGKFSLADVPTHAAGVLTPEQYRYAWDMLSHGAAVAEVRDHVRKQRLALTKAKNALDIVKTERERKQIAAELAGENVPQLTDSAGAQSS